MNVSVGICAYNEEKSIERVIRDVLSQRMPNNFTLQEVLIVSSGSTDKTEDIVRLLSGHDNRVKLLTEKGKSGKVSGLNIILREAIGDILILTDADVFPAPRSFMELVKPFKNEHVGAVGGRPIPLDSENTFWGFVGHLIWTKLQHRLLTAEMKQGIFFQLSGYLCAVRRYLIERIPVNVIDDDKYLGEAIRRRGFKVLYVPQAVVYIYGPKSTRDFLNQRARVLTGHLQFKKSFNLDQISTSNPCQIASTLLGIINFSSPKKVLWTFTAIVLESIATFLAKYNFVTGNIPYNWQMVPTTKSTAEC